MIERISNRLRRWNAVYYPQRVFQSPKWLVLGVNNTCNLHCKMCDVGVSYTHSNFFQNLMGTRPLHMPLELFKQIVDQATRYFPNVKIGYAFTEPLIYVHLSESMQYAKKNGLFTSITTNALGLKKWAPFFNEVKLDEVNISLDGPPEVHNFIRGNEHSFSKAIEGIEALLSLNNNFRINVYCVITEWNAGVLNEFVKLLSSYQLTRVGLMHSNFTPQHIADHHNEKFGGLYPATASNTTDTKNETIDTDLLWNEIRQIKETRWNFPVEFFPEINSPEQLNAYYRKPEIFIGKRCMDIFSNIMIKSNGDVIPSHGRCFNLKIGNLYESNLLSIWNSKVVSKFRTEVTEYGGLLPGCSRCCSAFVR
jgi:Fe-coproporphyrin III synthase